ncbi:glucosamine-6-phosphate deaminase [Adhaeribacter arboris]|uniref:Glucosamine-6-phosphate deaminase n=2 Tax=Adhaeribacter arboris TaxID=2072846 RepID=A0A2T2YLT8_9BACT|nr:glucosamine-6-phosphate deaminase [Adhaeribacter arboris]
MSKAAADFVREYVQQKPNALLCFPSGESPTGMLHYLGQYAQAGQVDFSKCTFVGLDEWVGMDETNEGSCRHYLNQHLFEPLGIKPENRILFNAKAPDLDQECERMNALIAQHGVIDLMVVGVGMNGHIGLNEPGVSFDLYAHHMALDEVTKTVGQKYFKQQTELHEGITLGLKHFQEAHYPVLIAAGGKKAGILAQALEGKVTNQVPASILQILPNAQVFLDWAVATQLTFAAAK